LIVDTVLQVEPETSEGRDLLSPTTADKRYFRHLLIGRSATVIAIGLLMVIMETQIETTAPSLPIFFLLAVLLALTGIHYLVEQSGVARTRTVSLAVITLDTLLLAVGLYLLGGQSALYGLPAYGILIVMAAVVHSRSACYGIAVLGSISFLLMVTASTLRWIPVREQLFPLSFEDTFPLASVATTFALSMVMALVASSLSQIKDSALSRSQQLEIELLKVNRSLEGQIEIAVADLRDKNRALHQAVEKFQLYSRAVAHDLRNPLTAAGEFLTLSRSSEAEATRAQYFEHARENLLRADRMLIGLRDVMRIASFEPGRAAIEIRPVIDGLLSEFSDVAGRTVQIELEGDFGSARIPSQQIEHIFRNLVGNAIHHNPEVDRLTIEIGKVEIDGEPAFFVRDDGEGIPSSAQPRIFMPFRQGLEPQEERLGLGLAVVEAIVTNAGGRIWCESVEGHGATFWFTLPETVTGRF
jgi:signal transduction histidine kinase